MVAYRAATATSSVVAAIPPPQPPPRRTFDLQQWLNKRNMPSLNHTLPGGFCAIHVAAFYGDFDAIQYLCQQTIAQVDDVSDIGYTPAMIACMNPAIAPLDRCQVAQRIICELGSNCDIVNGNGETVLFVAVRHGISSLAMWLLNTKRRAVTERTPVGCNLMFYACAFGDERLVQFMLDHCRVMIHAETADSQLAYICSDKDSTAIISIVDHGCNAFLAACRAGCKNIVSLLLARFPKLIATRGNNDGETPLTAACLNYDWTLCEILIEASRKHRNLNNDGADLTTEPNRAGYTPLMIAASCNNVVVVTHLLQFLRFGDRVAIEPGTPKYERYFAAIHAKCDDTGDTALHMACANACYEVVLILLSNGASPCQYNLDRSNVLHAALSSRKARMFTSYEDVVQYKQMLHCVVHFALPPRDSPWSSRTPIYRLANNNGNTPFLEAAAHSNLVGMEFMVFDLPRVLWHAYVQIQSAPLSFPKALPVQSEPTVAITDNGERVNADGGGHGVAKKGNEDVGSSSVLSDDVRQIWMLPLRDEDDFMHYFPRFADLMRQQRNDFDGSLAGHIMTSNMTPPPDLQLQKRKQQNPHCNVQNGAPVLQIGSVSSLRQAYDWIGCSFHERNAMGDTPFSIACLKGHLRAAQWMVQCAGISDSCWEGNARGVTPMMNVCISGDINFAAWIFAHYGNFTQSCLFLMHASDQAGMTPLLYAAAHGSLPLMRYIIIESCIGIARHKAMLKAAAEASSTADTTPPNSIHTDIYSPTAAISTPAPGVVLPCSSAYWKSVLKRDACKRRGKCAILLAAEFGHLKMLKWLVIFLGEVYAQNVTDNAGRGLVYAALLSNNTHVINFAHKVMKCQPKQRPEPIGERTLPQTNGH